MKTSSPAFVYGRQRPAKGPYPKGVWNGPAPRTKRGIRRRLAIAAKIKDTEISGDR